VPLQTQFYRTVYGQSANNQRIVPPSNAHPYAPVPNKLNPVPKQQLSNPLT
jgi:hypothetical protein